jgi:hypothetical protein
MDEWVAVVFPIIHASIYPTIQINLFPRFFFNGNGLVFKREQQFSCRRKP